MLGCERRIEWRIDRYKNDDTADLFDDASLAVFPELPTICPSALCGGGCSASLAKCKIAQKDRRRQPLLQEGTYHGNTPRNNTDSPHDEDS